MEQTQSFELLCLESEGQLLVVLPSDVCAVMAVGPTFLDQEPCQRHVAQRRAGPGRVLPGDTARNQQGKAVMVGSGTQFSSEESHYAQSAFWRAVRGLATQHRRPMKF